ncbi:GNAT family N-acetyltransferase [archaeon]
MEKEIGLKDGRTVLVRDLQPNEDVIGITNFFNGLIEEKAFLVYDEKQSPEEEADWLRGQMSEIEAGRLISWRVLLDGRHVGGVNAQQGKWKERGNVEVGIALAKEVRGQGLGHELMSLMIEAAKEKWSPHHLFLRANPQNKAALKLYEDLGFKEFVVLKEWEDHYGEYIDTVWLVLKGT